MITSIAGDIEEWAREHDLPYYDDQVHFPDVRIEYGDVDGDVRHRDIEVTTSTTEADTRGRQVGRASRFIRAAEAVGLRLIRTSRRTSMTLPAPPANWRIERLT